MSSGPRFYKDHNGEVRWNVVASNESDILGDSGEGYHNAADAANGLAELVFSVLDHAGVGAGIATDKVRTFLTETAMIGGSGYVGERVDTPVVYGNVHDAVFEDTTDDGPEDHGQFDDDGEDKK